MPCKKLLIIVLFVIGVVSRLYSIIEYNGAYFQQVNVGRFLATGKVFLSAGLDLEILASMSYPFFVTGSFLYQELFSRAMGGLGVRIGIPWVPFKIDVGGQFGISQVNTEEFIGTSYKLYVSPRFYFGSEFNGIFIFGKAAFNEVWSYIKNYTFLYIGFGFGVYY